MASLVGPSHHIYFGSLHRRRIWLEQLAQTFSGFAAPEWTAAKTKLDQEFGQALNQLPTIGELGLSRPLPLQSFLDDTPIESFLANLSEQLDLYEAKLLETMQALAIRHGWAEDLDRVSMLWGRELVQESLSAPNHGALVRSQRSVRGVFEAIHNVVEGGNFVWKPFLLRRYTNSELQYELRICPHRKPAFKAHGAVADLACRLESMVFRGFSEALLASVSYGRQVREGYCMDELRLIP